MNKRLESALSILLTIAALVVAGAAVRREFGPAARARGSLDRDAAIPTYVDSWEAMTADGITTGASAAPVRVIEFSDLECPFCARFHRQTLPVVQREHEAAVSVTFIHLPLRMHRFATPAAQAAECAAAQGRFDEYVDAVFLKQDSLGLKTWWSYGRDALIPDSLAFANCIAGPLHERIDAGRKWAEKLGVDATPTILVNGWRLPKPPGPEELSKIIQDLRLGKKPFAVRADGA